MRPTMLTEGRDVEPQHTVEIHTAKPVRDTSPGARRILEEQSMIARVLPELLVDQVKIPLNESDGVGADAAHIILLLQQEKQSRAVLTGCFCKYPVTR